MTRVDVLVLHLHSRRRFCRPSSKFSRIASSSRCYPRLLTTLLAVASQAWLGSVFIASFCQKIMIDILELFYVSAATSSSMLRQYRTNEPSCSFKPYAASLDRPPPPLPISLLLPGAVTASGRFCRVNGVLSIVLPSFFQSLICSRMIPAALSGVSCLPMHSTKSPSGSMT